MLKKLLLVSFVSFSTISMVQPAFAADQTFCGQYARTSMAQYKFAQSKNCGMPVNKKGWYQNFDYPYAWCREVTKEKANEQTNRRYALIGKCMMK